MDFEVTEGGQRESGKPTLMGARWLMSHFHTVYGGLARTEESLSWLWLAIACLGAAQLAFDCLIVWLLWS